MSPVDGSMNTDYADELIRACSVSPGTSVDCDSGSSSAFDNRYYANLLDGRGLLRTDAVLVQNASTRATVAAFAQSQDAFFSAWADSFARLSSLGVKTGTDGEIRRACSSVNG
jgi:peroxidase